MSLTPVYRQPRCSTVTHSTESQLGSFEKRGTQGNMSYAPWLKFVPRSSSRTVLFQIKYLRNVCTVFRPLMYVSAMLCTLSAAEHDVT